MRITLRRIADLALSSRGLLLVVLAAGAVAGTAFLFGGSDHTVTARFADADGLVAGNEIRVAGIEAGSVKSVGVVVDPQTGQQYAEAELSIDDAHWPLHQGTKVGVRPKGVLSNVFVNLEPGSSGAPALPAGHVFPLSETSSPINLDEFSNIFDPDVRTAIRTQIQEGVIALGNGGAANLNGTIHNLDPLTSDLSPVTAVLAARSPELDRLNTEFNTVVTELSSEDANLRGLVQNGATFLGALADRQHELQGTLDHAASTLTSIDSGLKGEEGNLQAIFQKGPASLDKTDRNAKLLTPLIADVNPHIASLDQLLYDFVSATGFTNGTKGGIDTLRVDASLQNQGTEGFSCGGEPDQQPNCPFNNLYLKQPRTSSTGAQPGGATTASTIDGAAPLDTWAAFAGVFG